LRAAAEEAEEKYFELIEEQAEQKFEKLVAEKIGTWPITDNLNKMLKSRDTCYLVDDLKEVENALRMDIMENSDTKKKEDVSEFLNRHNIKYYDNVQWMLGQKVTFKCQNSSEKMDGRVTEIDETRKSVTIEVKGKKLPLKLEKLEIEILLDNSQKKEKNTDESHRYMDVDLLDFLGKIADKTLSRFTVRDWESDREILINSAASEKEDDQLFIWRTKFDETRLDKERDVFISNTEANHFVTYHDHNLNPDILAYIVEITGQKEGTLIGNVFEIGNYEKYMEHVEKNSQPLDSVTFTMNTGRTIVLDEEEFEKELNLKETSPLSKLMQKDEIIKSWAFHPSDEARLAEIRQKEHEQRMSYPIGDPREHIEKVGELFDKIRETKGTKITELGTISFPQHSMGMER
jgi:hypothetical protein